MVSGSKSGKLKSMRSRRIVVHVARCSGEYREQSLDLVVLGRQPTKYIVFR